MLDEKEREIESLTRELIETRLPADGANSELIVSLLQATDVLVYDNHTGMVHIWSVMLVKIGTASEQNGKSLRQL